MTTQTLTPETKTTGNRHETPLPSSDSRAPERSLTTHGAFVLPWLKPGMNALDCGCGPGTITLGLADAAFPGHVTGIDLQPALIEQAQRLSWGLEQMNADFRCANTYELPFADATFDLVFSHALFEHLARPASALAEMRRVLAPGGLLALCSPDWDGFLMTPSPAPVRDAFAACRSLQTRNGGNPRSGQLLAPWAREAGFKILEQETRFEADDCTPRICAHLVLQLQAAGEWEYAHILKTWASRKGSRFTQAWTHVVAQK